MSWVTDKDGPEKGGPTNDPNIGKWGYIFLVEYHYTDLDNKRQDGSAAGSEVITVMDSGVPEPSSVVLMCTGGAIWLCASRLQGRKGEKGECHIDRRIQKGSGR